MYGIQYTVELLSRDFDKIYRLNKLFMSALQHDKIRLVIMGSVVHCLKYTYIYGILYTVGLLSRDFDKI